MQGLLITLLVGGLLTGFVLAETLGGLGEQHVVDELDQRAHSAAAAMDAEHVGSIRGTSADELSPEFSDVQKVLDATLQANPDLSYTYIMRSVSGRAVFLAEAVRSGETPSPPGTVYAEATPELLDSLQSGKPLIEGPTTDQWGTWYSAIRPIVDTDTGEVVGHLGMDLPAATVAASRMEYRLAGLALSLAVAALVIGFYVVVQMTRASASVLSGSEARFHSLFEHAPDAIMVASIEDKRLLAVNPRAAEWLAAPAQDIVGQPLKRFAHCQRNCECDRCIKDSDAILAKGSVLRALDGSERNVEFSTLETEYDGVPALVIFAHDVSLRSKIEQAMTAHAEFNSLVTDISRRFVDATPETVDTEIESALARIGAYSDVDRVYVFKFSDYQHMTNTHEWVGDGVPSRRGIFQESATDGYPFLTSRILGKREVYLPDVASDPELETEERLALQAAGIRSMLVVPISIFGTVVGMLGFDSLRAQKDWNAERIALLRMVADIIGSSLRRSEAESELMTLSQAIGQSPVAVMITDRNGDIEYVNPTFTRTTGYTLEESRGQNPRILKSGLSEDETYKDLWSHILAGEVWTGEFVNKRKDGTPYWARATISAMRTAVGEITHFIGVQEDVTEAREAQEALKTAKIQAESSNRAKSEFLATMSHEIRTPMNAIIGMSELLQDTELTRQQARYVDVFRRAGESLLGLINSILDLSKIEADRLEMEHIPFDLADITETAASVIGVQASEKGLELLYRIKPGTPTNLAGDPERLRQVFINLLGNAVKFTEIGQVLLSIEQQSGGTDGNLLIAVSDTGVGIPEDKIDAVFESFSQADASTTRRYGGTGLGLTISRRLVELMGGRMWVESVVGEGPTFYMEIPFLVSQDEIKDVPREAPMSLAGNRVLIVDDNETNRFILREVLTAWGMRTSDAPDGRAGLEAVRFAARGNDPYDVMILDHQMPYMDGYELLEQVRADKSISRTPAIMLSSDAHGRDQARAARLNLIDYLFKPVRRHELAESLQEALRGEWREPEPVKSVAAQELTRPLRVLLVEDSEDNRFLVQSYLEKTAHVVEEALDGQQAVDAVLSAKTPYDLVLMDMQMPVKDGLSATREIREWEAANGLEPTSIVALSAFALKEEHDRSMDAGCDAHLTKPIKKRE
ncbi:MAG: response regulator, partial [Coriobacteriia bacterium]|nr:response regulator [Coriobacteriia bacterium]